MQTALESDPESCNGPIVERCLSVVARRVAMTLCILFLSQGILWGLFAKVIKCFSVAQSTIPGSGVESQSTLAWHHTESGQRVREEMCPHS